MSTATHRSTPNRTLWLWPLTLAVGIFLASSRSRLAGPHIAGFDKLTHFAVYGLLGTLIVRALPGRGRAWLAVLLASLYGIGDEWHQSFTPGRSVEIADWVADTLGAGVGIFRLRLLAMVPRIARVAPLSAEAAG